MFPANLLAVPRVAELPTCQKTLLPVPPLIIVMFEPLKVVGVPPIWKMKTALRLPGR
jgi:hypothetical protein